MMDLFRDLGFVKADMNYRAGDEVDERHLQRGRRRRLAAFLWIPGLLVVLTVGAWIGANTGVVFLMIGGLLLGLVALAEWSR